VAQPHENPRNIICILFLRYEVGYEPSQLLLDLITLVAAAGRLR
jgi:hypothetical protein